MMNKQTTKTCNFPSSSPKKEKLPKERRPHAPSIAQVAAQLRGVKRRGIYDECRAFEEDEIPGIQVTLATDLTHRDNWAIQTGDNSYTGSAYGFAYWGVSGLYRRTNCRELAKELIEQVVEQWWGSQA
jgi:hypothetical protein